MATRGHGRLREEREATAGPGILAKELCDPKSRIPADLRLLLGRAEMLTQMNLRIQPDTYGITRLNEYKSDVVVRKSKAKRRREGERENQRLRETETETETETYQTRDRDRDRGGHSDTNGERKRKRDKD